MIALDFKTTYSALLEKVEKKIAEVSAVRAPETLYEPFSYIMSGGGKRIRPVLTMIACGAVGGNPLDVLPSAVAMEVLHNFTLAHDDIMDSSPVRRGKPTVHMKYNIPVGILLGDVMVGHAYRLLPSPNEHPRSHDIFTEFTTALVEVCVGQAYDIEFDEKDDVSVEDYLMMIDKKTSKLLEASATIGAHAGNATREQVKALRCFAHNVGIAFQIQDDLLDITAEQADFGKRIGQDIIEGKKTYLILTLKEYPKSDECKEMLELFFSKHGLPEEYITKFKTAFEEFGVFEKTHVEIERYFSLALNELDKLPQNEWTEMLRGLVKSLNKRKY
jgi:geranylgeranyl diphosphate synthase type II